MGEIPEHLLKRAQAAREAALAKKEGGGDEAAAPKDTGSAVATAERPAAGCTWTCRTTASSPSVRYRSSRCGVDMGRP